MIELLIPFCVGGACGGYLCWLWINYHREIDQKDAATNLRNARTEVDSAYKQNKVLADKIRGQEQAIADLTFVVDADRVNQETMLAQMEDEYRIKERVLTDDLESLQARQPVDYPITKAQIRKAGMFDLLDPYYQKIAQRKFNAVKKDSRDK